MNQDELKKLTISTASELLASKKLSSVELTQATLDVIEQQEPVINAFITVTKEIALARAKQVDELRAKNERLSILAGIPYSLKDVYNVKGVQTTGGAKILEGYISPYDATVEVLMKKSNAVLLGKTNCDSFGFGTTGEHSGFGPTKNPINIEYVPGGSSSGSGASLVYGGGVFSIGEDTGGSIRCPASFCGLAGLKTTYGRVSRYGAAPYASSYDTMGPMARNVKDVAIVLEHLAGQDARDATTGTAEVLPYSTLLDKSIKGMKIGMPKEYFGEGLDPEVRASMEHAADVFRSLGAEVIEISLPYTEYAVAAYYVIGTSETSSNLARLDGIRYGIEGEGDTWMQKIKDVRGKGFNDEAKRRIMVGTYALSAGYADQYYKKAQQVRQLLKKDFVRAFTEVDVIMTPTMPVLPPKIGENESDPLKLWLMDAFTVSVNPVGVPGLSVPTGFAKNGLPIGMQLIAPHFREDIILNVGYQFEQEVK
ncbi:Asp-tRNA(Asn)/Glu-tRNA(Gln) amidotransferase GatCAB subunit A [Candidatus Dojkabacteria bacterium CG_4_9_14_3_um_filter_150_Dojkabacteria_WS6_41_13]|uniref:Glutamyl-tRNA(Gln) amidotransferase subunit A n=1 Tax=Candidatus Dojkabacteria bacterium CG_4_10_14_0_2_um_filter_Dojkabacteria_WS6_41_15 TaxID=2014249 RepID=A0A2M7W267_9BACT|nr:MAG: Asp-tRNA(Asn)/Glu-tRNA(Gln) amidotransferase GatCAB subunit A [Candidatus Dojkabacteria bacterium CG_4_10_14_0_2_um_filter_Dojkabacteria_WS6_41_15]PJB23234.1 MAG: Asp-tRNA(Asn)/Glu-tRNA(Gln) amidotransferase GatCAB subunit A [Candidatus Dojkabacteria bacterium CG_4_9_14_3_um_filter_150_Dojkabacteria_WS6_41_13]